MRLGLDTAAAAVGARVGAVEPLLGSGLGPDSGVAMLLGSIGRLVMCGSSLSVVSALRAMVSSARFYSH